MPVLLNTAYFPPIEYFALMARDMRVLQRKGSVPPSTALIPSDVPCGVPGLSGAPAASGRKARRDAPEEILPSTVYMEACENYQKQSYRNRCHFYAGNGLQTLSFPIIHVDGTHNNIPVREVRVDYSVDWVTRHERAIVSAYRTSAYFDYYCDELFSILDSRPETLFGLNTRIIEFFIRKTGLAVDLRETSDFVPYGSSLYGDDFREKIHPKRRNTILADLQLEKPYFQVFSGKYGFIPNLSIMDLLFNEGPDSISYLLR